MLGSEGKFSTLFSSRKWLVACLVFAHAIVAQAQEADTEINRLCDNVIVAYEYDLNFTGTERRLLCGSSGIEAWEQIPLRQAQFLMQNFLEARGYHHPVFTIEGEQLTVQPGIPTLINELSTQPPIEDLRIEKYWLPRGKPLTPTELDGIEKWVGTRLSRLGYPCPEIRSVGDPETGEVIVALETGPLWTIDKIDADPIPYIRGGILDRYHAFDMGDRYNSMLLELSSERLRASGAVINTQYLPLCQEPRPGTVRQITFAGKPRIVSFGFGFDTEELFKVRGSWTNTRFSETASSLDVLATASYVSQVLQTRFNWYYLPFPTRHYLKSSIRAEREVETYESLRLKVSSTPAWTSDFAGLHAEYFVGPGLQFESTVQGNGPKATRLLTLDLGLSLESNFFEYYRANPLKGYQLNLNASMSEKSIASDVSALTYSIDFTRIWNLLDMDPEIWILGLRGNFATTEAGRDTKAEELPLSFKQFLGGSENLRGFKRRSLPEKGGDEAEGSLTAAYIGSELRLNNVIPYKLQPFIFADFGWLGEQYLKLYPRLYWSPGLGMRWESPIGGLRVTAGHGYVSGKNREEKEGLEQWQFYFSLGEQF